jgi:N-methylhydantoinase A/acetophenone carboxylase
MGGINLECFHMTAVVALPPLELEAFEGNDQKPSGAASLPAREAFWAALEGFMKTPVFAFNELLVGNEIDGPALVEADDTTYVIEPGWRFVMDRFRNAVLERNQA